MALLTEELQPLVVARLERSPATLRELEKSLGYNYYTIRKSVHLLIADGIVTSTGLGARNAKYLLRDADAKNDSMPIYTNGMQRFKLIDLLSLRHQKKTYAAQAIEHLPKHVARILMIAVRLKEHIPQGDAIQRARDEMEKDLANIQRISKLYEAVLNNPKNWTEATLLRYTEDLVWDETEVRLAYSELFGEE